MARPAAALAVALLAAACAGGPAPYRGEPASAVLRGYGHGYPWTGYQQTYLGRP